MNYQKLHIYLTTELGILPLETEMQEIVEIVKEMLADEKPPEPSLAVANMDKAWKEYHEAVEKAKKHLKDRPITKHYPSGC